MTMYDYLWPCTTKYDFVYLCMQMDAYVCLRLTMYDPVADMEKVDFCPQANFQGWEMSGNS